MRLKFLTLSLFLFVNNSFAEDTCKIKNSEYKFSYNYKNGLLNYKIFNLNNKSFKYYYKHIDDFPSELSISFVKEPTIFYNNKVKLPNSIQIVQYYNYYNYYYGRNNLYGVDMVSSFEDKTKFPLKDNDFQNISEINKTVNINDFISRIRPVLPKNYLTRKEVKFNIRLILDKDMENCLYFTTNQIILDN